MDKLQMHKSSLFWVLLLFSLATIGCLPTSDQRAISSVDGIWDKKKPLNFDFQINDAEVPKNISFVVRNNDDYLFSNLWVISKLSGKGLKVPKVDTLNYVLAKPTGEWLGKGFGETKEIKFQYKTNYIFPAKGEYQISITQAMRKDILPGIEDFGIIIEPYKP